MPKTGFVEGGFSSGGGSGGAAAVAGATGLPSASDFQSFSTHGQYCLFSQIVVQSGATPNPVDAIYPTANQAFYIPFWVPASLVVKQLWCYNGSTVAGDTDMAIYSASLTRLVSIGATAQAGTTAFQMFDIADTTLTGGSSYYLGLSHSENTGRIRSFRLTSSASNTMFKGLGVTTQASAHPLPDPFVPAVIDAATNNLVPVMGFTTQASF